MPSIASHSLPPRFKERTLDQFEKVTPSAEKALGATKRFVSGELGYLVLTGSTGVGKSHLAAAAAVARYDLDLDKHEHSDQHAETLRKKAAAMAWERVGECRSAPRSPLWQNVAELIVGLREDMDKPYDDKSWELILQELRQHPGVVVLDDLGREKVSDWTGETIYALVNRRYEYVLPTIVTTNLPASELAASPYWPVISRLAEDGELVRIEAPDYRLR